MPLDNGARIVSGDVSDRAGEERASKLEPSIAYLHCDTSLYSDQLPLFSRVEKLSKRIDIVVGNDGIVDYDEVFHYDKDRTKEP